MRIQQAILGAIVSSLSILPICVNAASAQDAFPNRPIRIIVGFNAGSSSDVSARVIAGKLAEVLKASVVVENKPGASSEIGARYVAGTTPDGYTLYLGTVANCINYAAKMESFTDLATGLEPIAEFGEVPNILVVTPSLDVHNVKDVIRLAKEKPGNLSYASAGSGTALHMAAELFSAMASVEMLHVPYQGSALAMPDLLMGRTSIMFAPASTVVSLIKSGKLRAIATTGAHRAAIMPDLPTVSEEGLSGFESSVWAGLLAPKGIPAAVEKKLEEAILAAASMPDVKEKFAAEGFDVIVRGQEDFTAYIKSENAKWAEVIRDRHLKLH
jgi:tripartite-type tricarboxylate transporter receptor subunit TctC